LDGNKEKLLRRHLTAITGFLYQQVTIPHPCRGPEILRQKSFWKDLPAHAFDVVLIDLDQSLLERLKADKSPLPLPPCLGPTALVAVLDDVSADDVALVAQWGFDGIILPPYEPNQLARSLQSARAKAAQKTHLLRRYQKIRRLCRAINRKRRKLRDKIDILCRDLVHSNMELTETLTSLQAVHNFQNELMGQFDLRYLLYKALRTLRDRVTDSSGAIYICAHDEIEAHLTGWCRDSHDIAEIEDALKSTLIARITANLQSLIVKSSQTKDIPRPHRHILTDLTLLGLPIITENELLAVLVLYRPSDQPFSQKDKENLQPLLTPLARAIKTIQKLEHHIVHS